MLLFRHLRCTQLSTQNSRPTPRAAAAPRYQARFCKRKRLYGSRIWLQAAPRPLATVFTTALARLRAAPLREQRKMGVDEGLYSGCIATSGVGRRRGKRRGGRSNGRWSGRHGAAAVAAATHSASPRPTTAKLPARRAPLKRSSRAPWECRLRIGCRNIARRSSRLLRLAPQKLRILCLRGSRARGRAGAAQPLPLAHRRNKRN